MMISTSFHVLRFSHGQLGQYKKFVYRRLKLGLHIRGKRKRHAAAACGCGMRYANDLIPYIRLPMRLYSLFLSE